VEGVSTGESLVAVPEPAAGDAASLVLLPDRRVVLATHHPLEIALVDLDTREEVWGRDAGTYYTALGVLDEDLLVGGTFWGQLQLMDLQTGAEIGERFGLFGSRLDDVDRAVAEVTFVAVSDESCVAAISGWPVLALTAR